MKRCVHAVKLAMMKMLSTPSVSFQFRIWIYSCIDKKIVKN